MGSLKKRKTPHGGSFVGTQTMDRDHMPIKAKIVKEYNITSDEGIK